MTTWKSEYRNIGGTGRTEAKGNVSFYILSVADISNCEHSQSRKFCRREYQRKRKDMQQIEKDQQETIKAKGFEVEFEFSAFGMAHNCRRAGFKDL